MPKDSSTRHRHSSATIASHRPPLEPDLTSLAVDVISSDDYFLKSDHFRLWLKQYKGKASPIIVYFYPTLLFLPCCPLRRLNVEPFQ